VSQQKRSGPRHPILKPLLKALRENKEFPYGDRPKLFLESVIVNGIETTPMHVAAETGVLWEIEELQLTVKSMLCKDGNGNTPLHIAAAHGTLSAAPPKTLTKKTLLEKNLKGETVIDLIDEHDILSILPPRFHILSREWVISNFQHLLENDALKIPDFLSTIDKTIISLSELVKFLITALREKKKLPIKLSPYLFLEPVPIHGINSTLLHVAAETGRLCDLEKAHVTVKLMFLKDGKGDTPLHIAATSGTLSSVPKRLLTKETLLEKNLKGQTVINLIDEHGLISILSPHLKTLSKKWVISHFYKLLENDFLKTPGFLSTIDQEIIPLNELHTHKVEFVQNWVKSNIVDNKGEPVQLDHKQAEAVADNDTNMQVVARAGSGKTRTLVTRIIFQINHCKISPGSILALAFNKKAAKEIRKRLSEQLPPNVMPHVMTFHALAWRIVQPNSDVLFDPEGHDSKKKLSQTIKKIIEKRFQKTETTETLQHIMRIQWEESLDALVKNCLKANEITKEIHQRELVEDRALDYRRVDNASDKWTYNFLIWHDVEFTYKKNIHYHGGDVHQATFLIPRDGQKDLVIESSAPAQQNAATTAFQRSPKANSYEIQQLSITTETDRKNIHIQLRQRLDEAKIPYRRLSKEELWEKIKKDQIDAFTKSVQQFIGRCQKELMWPDDLEKSIESYNAPEEIQELFWKESLNVYRDYEDELARTNQTDFDRLLLGAATHIEQGNTRFRTNNNRIPGDIKLIKHLLIDEFQDFSHLFNRLRQSILKATPDVQFFCVGDDWQAINRFAGSNVCYFHDFPENFPSVTTIGLQTNYRSCTKIVDEGNLVMKGLGDPSIAHTKEAGKIYQTQICNLHNLTAEEEILGEASSLLACHIMRIAQSDGMPLAYLRDSRIPNNPKRKVVVLSRHSKIEGSTLEQWQNTLRSHLDDHAKPQIEFSTSHGYKGQEADTVILLNPEKYPLIHPDSIFSTIFGENLNELEMDERRLFYVAVTRAESNLIYLREKADKSCEFIPSIDQLEELNIAAVQPFLLSGDKALIEVKNLASISDFNKFGTIPLKDEIKSDFAWKPDKKSWVKSVASEQVQISKSVIALLSKFPWHRKIEQVEIKVSTSTLTYNYELNKGNFKRLDAHLTPEQQEQLDTLKDTVDESLAEAIEAILLDLKQDWPIIGYECEMGDVMEIAWIEDKIGLYLPGDDIQYYKKQGWRLIEITPELCKTWEKSLLPCFNRKASTRVLNEGIHALYHFTDVSNLESIAQLGLLSLQQLQSEEVPFTPGGNELSQQLDQDNKLDDYVHLCLTPHHPMAHQAKDRGSISDPRFLKIKPKVLDLPGVMACMNVSVAANAEIIPLETALSNINWADWTNYWNDNSITGLEDFADNPMFKIEILIPKEIPKNFI